MDPKTTEIAYAYCQQVCKIASTNFYGSFSTLELEKRRAVHAVYTLCKWVDDIVDGDQNPSVKETEDLLMQTKERDEILREIHFGSEPSNSKPVYMQRLMALVAIRNDLKRASLGQITPDDNQVFIALQDVFINYPIRLQDFETVIEGMEDDLFPVKCKTWDDLRAYSYKVASAVGLILIEIYGYDDQAARLHAIDLGIQMQLINILRDVSEDLERGRVYLPIDVLQSHGIDVVDLTKPSLARNPSWSAFVNEYLGIVKQHQISAMLLFDYLDSRSRVQPKIMLNTYQMIFNHIIRKSGDVLTKPLKVPKSFKLRLWAKINFMKLKNRLV